MTAASQPSTNGRDERYEEDAFLAAAYRALLANEELDDVLGRVVEAARTDTNCRASVLARSDAEPASNVVGPLAGPWRSGELNGPFEAPTRPSLVMPVVVNGIAGYELEFYKHAPDGRFSDRDIAQARRYADIAGLVISGARIGSAIGRLTRIDDETGVLVRFGFEEDVFRALEEHDGHAGLMIVRICDLEQINGRWGREVGDEVLRHVARTLREAIGSEGTVGRLRRHEFAGLLPGLDFARTAEIAGSTRGMLANPLSVLGRSDVYASIAIGMAAAQGGSTHSVIPLLHATYQALEVDARAQPKEPRTSRFGF